MSCTPLICSSSGVATVSAITFGFAPGYVARTTTEGGTTSGYSEIGSRFIAMAPARKMIIETTPAKIGRSMKNLERFICLSRCHPDFLRRHHRARPHALQAVHDDAFAGLQPRRHDAQAL